MTSVGYSSNSEPDDQAADEGRQGNKPVLNQLD
jgi:hypothetical protein